MGSLNSIWVLPPIQEVLRMYGEIPPERGLWTRMRCLWHDDTRASAAYSVEFNAFGCLGCGMRGNSLTLVMKAEGCTGAQARRIFEQEGIGGGSLRVRSMSDNRKSSSALFGITRDQYSGRTKVSIGLCGYAS